jgi:hypothetical protein
MLPTFSIAFAASLALSLNKAQPDADVIGATSLHPGQVGLHWRCLNNRYYTNHQPTAEASQAVEVIRTFAESLLNQTVESPQTIINAVNEHFWDLV